MTSYTPELRAELDANFSDGDWGEIGAAYPTLTAKIDADAIRIDALEGENARLREALQPFAREAACWDADANDGYDFPDHEPLEMESALQVKHLRIARAVHASTGAS